MRRMISEQERNKIKNISFGADVSTSVKYQLASVEFVKGTTVSNNKLKFVIKQYQPASLAKLVIDLTFITESFEVGALFASNVTEASDWDVMWIEYTGAVTCEEGQCKYLGSGNGIVCKINGVTKSYGDTLPVDVKGENIVQEATSAGITYYEGIPEGYTTFNRFITLSSAS